MLQLFNIKLFCYSVKIINDIILSMNLCYAVVPPR